jgi:hypothetical protein
MSINYTWTIGRCKHEIVSGGITVAHWRVVANDGEHNASAYGSCGFTPNSSSPDFVHYSNVTEDLVLGWVFSSKDFEKDQIELNLKAKINSQKAPTHASGLPWGENQLTQREPE